MQPTVAIVPPVADLSRGEILLFADYEIEPELRSFGELALLSRPYLSGHAIRGVRCGMDVDAELIAVHRRHDQLVEPGSVGHGHASKAGAPETWLNDAVKGYLSPRGEFDDFLDLPQLKVFVARPEYLLAMKCASMRLGEEFHDLDDVRYLLRYLDIAKVDDALAIVGRYFDEEQLLPKTRLLLEELLGER